MQVEPGHIHHVSGDAGNLMFGGGSIEKIPHEGLKDFGPFAPPPNKHIRIFFIVQKDDTRRVAKKLAGYLKSGHSFFPGLPRYANVPMRFSDEHVVFANEDNPLPEIRAQLAKMPFGDGVQHHAIYVSPISKDTGDPDKFRVYYRVKEELLKYGVSCQVVFRDNVSEPNFKYYLPNLSVAILAKLGGVPWQLASPPRRELIVGVGAFRSRKLKSPYVGSAFCFSDTGKFRGFQCFSSRETGMLAGSIRKAVHRYVRDYGKPERLIVHYYKRMSYRERKPIVGMLHNLGLDDLPVVVVTINKTDSRDVVVFDELYGGRIPLSGTFIQLDDDKLLLCNNTRYEDGKKAVRRFPFPVKLNIATDIPGFMEDEACLKEIVDQVYQFSRIYWKSIAQQNLPVTIRYPELVAEMFPYFEGNVIPKYGRENLWFL
jgi:hypothetical protein